MLEELTDLVKKYRVGIAIGVLDTIAAGLVVGRQLYGLEYPLTGYSELIFSNFVPHFVICSASYITATYVSYRCFFNTLGQNVFRQIGEKLPEAIRNHPNISAAILGVVSTIPVFAREIVQYMEGAPDSFSDSLWSIFGIFAGVRAMPFIRKHIEKIYNATIED